MSGLHFDFTPSVSLIEMLRCQRVLTVSLLLPLLSAPLHVMCCVSCLGRQLFGHQRSVRCHLQDGGQHDQRQNPGGDQEDIQHQK